MNTPIPPLIPAGSNLLGNNLIGPNVMSGQTNIAEPIITGPTTVSGQITVGTNTTPSHVNIFGDGTSRISLGNGDIVIDGGSNIISTSGEVSCDNFYVTYRTTLAIIGPLGFFGSPPVSQQTFATPTPVDLPTAIARLNEVTTILYNYGLTSNF